MPLADLRLFPPVSPSDDLTASQNPFWRGPRATSHDRQRFLRRTARPLAEARNLGLACRAYQLSPGSGLQASGLIAFRPADGHGPGCPWTAPLANLRLASASFPVGKANGYSEPLPVRVPGDSSALPTFLLTYCSPLANTNVSSGVLLVPLRRPETLGWLARLTSSRREPACRLPGSSPFDPPTVTVQVAPDRAAGQPAVGFSQFPRWQRIRLLGTYSCKGTKSLATADVSADLLLTSCEARGLGLARRTSSSRRDPVRERLGLRLWTH
jgi:hypothetical protein